MKPLGIWAVITVAVLVAPSSTWGCLAASYCLSDPSGYHASGVSPEDACNNVEQLGGNAFTSNKVELVQEVDDNAWSTELPERSDPADLVPVPEPVSIVIWSVAGGVGAAAALAAKRRRRQVRGRWSEESRRAILDVIEGKRRASSSHLVDL